MPTIYDSLTKNHIDSFNFGLDYSLPKGIKHLKQLELEYDKSTKLEISIYKVEVGKPVVHKDARCKTRSIYPSECRQAGFTYKAPLKVSFQVKINDKLVDSFEETAGELPIMVKSNRCNLNGFTSEQLVEHREDSQEAGGYFIVNGNEKLVRFLIAQMRNYPIVMTRKSWKKAAKLTSDLGVHCRCVREDQVSNDMIIHYLTNGSVKIRVLIDKMTVYLPLMLVLKALCGDYSNKKISQRLMQGCEHDTFYYACVTNMIKQIENEKLNTQDEILSYIGARTRSRYYHLEKWHSDQEIAHYLLRNSIAVHVDSYEDKFNFLVFCTKKLFAAKRGDCGLENVDSPQLQEIYTSGQIYTNYLLERLSMFMHNLKLYFLKLSSSSNDELSQDKIRRSIQLICPEISREMIRFLSVGSIRAQSTAGLRQDTSFSVIAEKINYYRFISHFRAVHRGSFFMEMRTTECRRLYPESYGFLCPVHTPDGAPCGLLNHLTLDCQIVSSKPDFTAILDDKLNSLGLIRLDDNDKEEKDAIITDFTSYTHVLLDGRVIGFVEDGHVDEFVRKLRRFKKKEPVLSILEIGCVPKSNKATQYSAIYLMTTPCRMMRPVRNLETRHDELIGIFEQVYLEIAIKEEERYELTTHQELKPTAMLSLLASLIPYSDFNQSPRNMYCCQMKKQTMGTACHSLKYRSENKIYTITTPQTPFCRNEGYDEFNFDEYPLGTNAVVAVISYTGYDMEDALILNKSSVERGFKDGSISRSMEYDLKEMSKSLAKVRFGRQETDVALIPFLDIDGLPFIGTKLKYNDPICSYIDLSTLETKVERYKYTEQVYVSDVKLIGNEMGSEALTRIVVTLHISRRPAIGDKFANRHGQKGVVSYLYPNENMPFTSSGMTPDVIFNPHGFPSRMTIGQMLESMAGKVTCFDGKFKDSTPFKFSEDNPANEYYGELLKANDFNYYGTETMYSGVDGRPLNANIFVGVVYYIRLRHMVGDKYQVRSTGPIDQLTHQPVKGRKRCGGIRFGEMERDSLVAHGASFLLQDRLYNQSDKSLTHICTKCKSILTPVLMIRKRHENVYTCRMCETSEFIKPINIPYVVKYLAAELASVNIKMQFSVTD